MTIYCTCLFSGGLGNQLFQIAIAYCISKEMNYQLCFQKGQFKGCGQGNHPSKYYNSIYNKLKFVDTLPNQIIIKHDENWKDLSNITEHIKNVLEHVNICDNLTVCLSGYFQNYAYYKHHIHEIKDIFKIEQMYYDVLFHKYPFLQLVNENDCIIGVRRGDYLLNSCWNVCDMNYYKRGILNMKKHQKYYIFSDDLAWCKSNFKGSGDEFVFIDIKDDFYCFLTMTLFKNFIISNSSFHWWGSLLSTHENTNITAPDKWSKSDFSKLIYRDEMRIISR